jgi:hypothetical protein
LDAEMPILATSKAVSGIEVDGPADLTLVFDLDKLLGNVDFSTAEDVNNNDRFEINPKSKGANAALFKKIQANLESSVIFQKK